MSSTVYPKVGCYTTVLPGSRYHQATEEQKARIAKTGLISVHEPRAYIQEMRERNPDHLMFFQWMPQFLGTSSSRSPYADWSMISHFKNKAIDNNWFLKRHQGYFTKTWGHYWSNWTTKCPRYNGMTFHQWQAKHGIPDYMKDWHGTGEDWGPGSPIYNGLLMEVIAEDLWQGWFGTQYNQLDYDNDGIAESWASFKAEVARCTEEFLRLLRAEVGEDFPIIGGGDDFMPHLSNFQGIKMEDAFYRNGWSWEEEFFGVPHRQRGYVLARDNCRDSWNSTLISVEYKSHHADKRVQEQEIRLYLGTACLGDGWFLYHATHEDGDDIQEQNPFWFPEYDLPLGNYGMPYRVDHNQMTGKAVYFRFFYEKEGDAPEDWTGFVAVNPYDTPYWGNVGGTGIGGVPPKDAVFLTRDPGQSQGDWKQRFLAAFNSASPMKEALLLEAILGHVGAKEVDAILDRYKHLD